MIRRREGKGENCVDNDLVIFIYQYIRLGVLTSTGIEQLHQIRSWWSGERVLRLSTFAPSTLRALHHPQERFTSSKMECITTTTETKTTHGQKKKMKKNEKKKMKRKVKEKKQGHLLKFPNHHCLASERSGGRISNELIADSQWGKRFKKLQTIDWARIVNGSSKKKLNFL
jgi:hypothetical protein